MATFRRIIAELKKQERRLAAQLAGIRTAISSLEFGSSGAPAPAIIKTPNAAGRRSKKRSRPKMSAAARKAVSARMKRYWAARRRTAKS
jgi:hypothetical protein